MRFAALVGAPYCARLTLTTPPAAEPVDAAALRTHSRIDSTDEDAYLLALAKSAREWVETYLGRQLITATWTMTMDAFPEDGIIEVPRPPLQAISSLKYYDADRVQQTFAAANYHVHAYEGQAAPMGSIELISGAAWPTLYLGKGAIQIAFTAGYGDDAGEVPNTIRQAVSVFAAELYERREESVVGMSVSGSAIASERLLWPLRVY